MKLAWVLVCLVTLAPALKHGDDQGDDAVQLGRGFQVADSRKAVLTGTSLKQSQEMQGQVHRVADKLNQEALQAKMSGNMEESQAKVTSALKMSSRLMDSFWNMLEGSITQMSQSSKHREKHEQHAPESAEAHKSQSAAVV
eukprot:TRINITY_DN91290_c0_g1_i1.p2 TRINITY_DN91290_c0_g1~~TRINITY_DN91290_c0_g1_i1.p2  ORF type:complete len:141 (+),score=41.67 TRINITY_DN91290_c0_g1_i1:58-480(+)